MVYLVFFGKFVPVKKVQLFLLELSPVTQHLSRRTLSVVVDMDLLSVVVDMDLLHKVRSLFLFARGRQLYFLSISFKGRYPRLCVIEVNGANGRTHYMSLSFSSCSPFIETLIFPFFCFLKNALPLSVMKFYFVFG